MSYLFTINANITVHDASAKDELQAPSGTDLLELAELNLSSSEEPEDSSSPLYGVASFNCSSQGEPQDWKTELSSALSSLGEEVVVEDYIFVVNPEAADEMADQVRSQVEAIAAAIHQDWQNAPEQASRSVRRKPAKDDEWVEKALAEAELEQYSLNAEQLEQFKAGKNDFLDSIEVDLGPGQGLELLSPDGERVGVAVDILSTEYQDLPKNWQEDNLAAAEGAAQLIADSIAENGSFSIEAIAEQIHEQWLERNPWAKDGEQGADYADLSQEDKDRDSTVAWTVISSLS